MQCAVAVLESGASELYGQAVLKVGHLGRLHSGKARVLTAG